MSNKKFAEILKRKDAAEKKQASSFIKKLLLLLPKGSLVTHEHTTMYRVVVPISKHASVAVKGNSITFGLFDNKQTPAMFREHVIQTLVSSTYAAGVDRGTNDTTDKLVNRMKDAVEHILLTDPKVDY